MNHLEFQTLCDMQRLIKRIERMKHTEPHKLDFACLGCVKKHIEHKERLISILRLMSTSLVCSCQPRECLACDAKMTLDSIEADNE